ncbi:metallophosphoesterase family protein [Candidatus Leptofilum sp.]|uniref:metallophosphoesterase family protein n=1 Tax=Candidatus Leptofilum sp. TaxID=3241576 RepID=UPI003B5AE519
MKNPYLPKSIDPQEVVATIGLISDTHMPQRWPQLPTAVSQIFANVQMIFHAGDVGELWVLDELSQIAPVVAVHGNDETEDATRELPYQQIVTVAGQRLLIWHSHYPNRVDEMHARRSGDLHEGLLRNIARAKSAGAQLIHFGHWHLPLVFEHEGIVAVNAGAIASGNPFQQQTIQTVAQLVVLRDGRFHITHVNLAEPARPYTPQTDIAAGFAGNLGIYGRSILSPELEKLKKVDLSGIYHTDRGAFLDVWLPLAHRVWAGEKSHVTLDDLLVAVKTADIKEATRQKLLVILSQLV